MSLPTNSKSISNISSSQFYYLYDLDEIHDSYSNSNWLGLGGPKKNISTGYIPEDIIYTINESIKNKSTNANTSFFDDHPSVLNASVSKGDISIGSTPTNIYLTFVDEHAGYTNTIGYYFYIIDQNGDKQLIDNVNNDDAPSYHNNYYHPTIIFPNASHIGKSDNSSPTEKQDHGQLKCGDQRQLKGNNPDYSFQNINIGFFLIPNGWTTVNDGVVLDPSLNILYSSPELNPNYIHNSSNQDNNGIQSVIYNIDNHYILGFEDIERPNIINDQIADFNDILFYISSNQSLNITGLNINKLLTPDKLVKVHKCGESLKVKSNKIDNDTSKLYRFEHYININSSDETSRLKIALDNLTIEHSPSVSLVSSNKLSLVYNMSYSTLTSSLNDDEYSVSLFNKLSNLDDITIVSNNKTKFDHLLDFQHIYLNNDSLTEDYYLYSTDNNGNNEILVQSELNTNPVRLTDGALIWGDPHIETIFGESYLLPHIEGHYIFFKNNYITVNVYLHKPPSLQNHPIMAIRNSTFIKSATFTCSDFTFTVDMDTLVITPPESALCSSVIISNIDDNVDVVYGNKNTIVKQRYITINDLSFLCKIYPDYFDEIRNMISLSSYSQKDLRKSSGLAIRKFP
jgi:hypothetical protein